MGKAHLVPSARREPPASTPSVRKKKPCGGRQTKRKGHHKARGHAAAATHSTARQQTRPQNKPPPHTHTRGWQRKPAWRQGPKGAAQPRQGLHAKPCKSQRRGGGRGEPTRGASRQPGAPQEHRSPRGQPTKRASPPPKGPTRGTQAAHRPWPVNDRRQAAPDLPAMAAAGTASAGTAEQAA